MEENAANPLTNGLYSKKTSFVTFQASTKGLEIVSPLLRSYVSSLRSQKVQYLNALGSFVDSHTIRAEYGNGKHSIISGRRILVVRALCLFCDF